MIKILLTVIISAISIQTSYGNVSLYINDIKGSPSGYHYHWELTRWDANDATPNPCNKVAEAQCNIVLLLIDRTKPNEWYDSYHNSVPAKKYKTIGEIREAFSNLWGIPAQGDGNVSIYGAEEKNICLTLGYNPVNAYMVSYAVPGAACYKIPPPTLNCSITGDTNLNHGTIVESEINNHRVDNAINLTCNEKASLTASISGTDKENIQLKADGSLESKILINDQDAAKGVPINVIANQSTPIKISSILLKNGDVEVGPFHGSGNLVLIVD